LKLESQLEDQEKDQIRNLGEDEFVTLNHMFMGQKLRNLWLYPHDSPLRKFFKDEALFSEDDMSDIILRSFYRYLKGEDGWFGKADDSQAGPTCAWSVIVSVIIEFLIYHDKDKGYKYHPKGVLGLVWKKEILNRSLLDWVLFNSIKFLIYLVVLKSLELFLYQGFHGFSDFHNYANNDSMKENIHKFSI